MSIKTIIIHSVSTLKQQRRYGRFAEFSCLKQERDSFYDLFYEYLSYAAINQEGNKGLSLNTVGKNIKNLKAFLHWCFDKEVCTRFPLKHIVVEQVEADKVYLNEEEIQRLYALKYLSTTKKKNGKPIVSNASCKEYILIKNIFG
jgi:site-specific recombinase XerD